MRLRSGRTTSRVRGTVMETVIDVAMSLRRFRPTWYQRFVVNVCLYVYDKLDRGTSCV